MVEAHKRKLAKYQELLEQCRNRGWWAICEPVEVGCLGVLVAQSVNLWQGLESLEL